MNIFTWAKGQQLHNQGGLQNLTSAWVDINPNSKCQQMLSSADIDVSQVSQLQTSDLLLNEKDIQRNLKTSRYGIYSTLNMYFRDEMKELRATGKQLHLVVIPAIYPLPV